MKHSFEYFLNAIHYCLWLGDMKFGDFVGAIVNKLLSPIPKYLFTKEYKKKYEERLVRERKNIDSFFYDKKSGYHIGWANHWFGFFYLGYPCFLSFVLVGLADKKFGDLSTFVFFLLFGIPIGLSYIPAYRAVFTKDRYLTYFRDFATKGTLWHRKWKWITIAFCVGSIVMTLMGIIGMYIANHYS